MRLSRQQAQLDYNTMSQGHLPDLTHINGICSIAESWTTPPHSHSIVLSDDNALNYQSKFFPLTMKNRLTDSSEICALEFKGEFRRFGIGLVSATIDIDRSISSSFLGPVQPRGTRKKTVSSCSTVVMSLAR
ncbi:MAG TPA: hypothetical protein VHX61_03805 [Rhizomicrobium sp.]|jgi:hypothetical protein|nr:hypothetical protein [Rhizomicrobium sp.]